MTTVPVAHLYALSPAQVAREAVQWLLAKRGQYDALLRIDLRERVRKELGLLTHREELILRACEEQASVAAPQETDAWRTVEALTRYAQNGDVSTFAVPASHLGVLAAIRGIYDAVEYEEDGRHIGLPASVWTVLFGATGRARLNLGLLIAPRHLGALADVSPTRVRQLCSRTGPLVRSGRWGISSHPEDGSITAASALAWLAKRGVVIIPEKANATANATAVAS